MRWIAGIGSLGVTALVLAACTSTNAPSPTNAASIGASPVGETEGSSATPALTPVPGSDDEALARDLAGRYIDAQLAGDFATAYGMLSPQFHKEVNEADYAKERREFFAGANQAELTTTSRDVANWLPPGEPVDEAQCVLIGVHYP